MEEIRWFISNFPDFVKKMKSCSYHHNKHDLDLEHLENSVWNHAVISYSKALNYKYSNVIRWAALLHDIGRILTKRVDIKKKTICFGSYYGASAFLAYEVLNKTTLKEEQKLRIVKILSYQHEIVRLLKHNSYSLEDYLKLFEYDETLFNDLISYAKCDLHGRKVDETLKEEYKEIYKKLDFLEKQEFVFKKDKELIKKDKELFILVGPPCSGKSTWTKNFKEEKIVFSRDEFTLKAAQKHNIFTYNEASKLKRVSEDIKSEVNELAHQRKDELLHSSYKNIIIDNVVLNAHDRKYWINIFKDTHNINIVLFLTPYSNLLKRDIRRSREISKSIGKFAIIDNLKAFKYPLLSEDIDRIEFVLNK